MGCGAAAQGAAPAGDVATRTIASWGPSISVTLATSLVLVGAAAGFVGSVVQQSIVFASRAGQQTLERGYVWWYVLRPVWSAWLGSVVVLTVNAGLVSIGDDTTSAAVSPCWSPPRPWPGSSPTRRSTTPVGPVRERPDRVGRLTNR
jgi:hypothetical protein